MLSVAIQTVHTTPVPIDLAQFFRSYGFTIIKKAVGFGVKGRIIAGTFPYLSPYITMVVEK